MASYSNYEKQQLAKATQNNNTYATNRNKIASNYINSLKKSVDEQLKQQTGQLQQQQTALPEQYRKTYELNGLNEFANRLGAREKSANLGLSNSGYANNLQTSAGVMRQKADSATRLDQQSKYDDLTNQINTLIANAALQKQQQEAQAKQQAVSDILNNYSSLQSSALTNAANLYNTDVTANTASANRQADIANQTSQLEQQAAEQEQQRKQNLFISLILSGATYQDAYSKVYGS